MERNTIALGDCLEEIRKIPSESVDLVLTDPPYNIARKRVLTRKGAKDVSFDFGEWDYFDTEEAYVAWAKEWIAECYRVLKRDGHLFIWQDKLLPLRKVIEENDFELRNAVIWMKSNPLPQFQKVNFLSSLEVGLWATKNGSLRKNQVFNFLSQPEMHNAQLERGEEISAEEILDLLLGEALKDEGKYETFFGADGTVAVRSSIVMGKERLKHPTQKPLHFTQKLIKLFTNEGALVVDLFMGSGTVAEACLHTNRDFWGVEKEPNYHQMSLDRIAPYLAPKE